MGRSFLFTRQYVSNHMEYHGIGRSAGVQRRLDSRIGFLFCLTLNNVWHKHATSWLFFCFVRLILCRRCHVVLAQHSSWSADVQWRPKSDGLEQWQNWIFLFTSLLLLFQQSRVRWNHHFLKPSVSVGWSIVCKERHILIFFVTHRLA